MAVWLRYLNHKKDARISILSRAVIHLPGSYKLFKMLLDLKTENAKLLPASDPQWQETNYTFEQSLLLCHRYPLIWMAFCSFLMLQNRPTYTRRTFDRALMALPLTQHAQIWDLYLKFAKQTGGETCVRIWRRFLKIQPTFADQYVDILLELKPSRVAEAAMVLTTIIEYPEKFASGTKTQYQYWSLLCDIICQHPENIKLPASDHLVPINLHTAADRIFVLDVEKILRAGIARFSDQVGRLWNSLAQWWVIRQDLERARDVYEEALASVKTVRDFTLVFDAFAKMEQDILSMAMDHVKDGVPDQDCILDSVEIDLRLARLERLIDQRPLLLNNVLLRQNPHNVVEWTNRIQIVKETNIKEDVLRCYQNATNTIVPQKATGNPTELWIEHAKYCESITNLEMARSVFEKAVLVSFKKVNDLSNVYIEWAQMELRNNNPKGALRVIGRATSPTSGDLTINYNDESKSPQQRLFKCVKLWTFYIEVEESIGSISSVKAVYDRILELKIATPQVIMNYAAFLEKQKYYEDSYRIYERGIELFKYPIAFEIWNIYLKRFIDRFKGTKLERLRDLCENALEQCPPKFAKPLYFLYAKIEEDYGLAKNAMRIYDRALSIVPPETLNDIFVVYIAKATSFFGLAATREIYQKALEILPDIHAKQMAVKFSQLEIKLGEVDRARAIYAYASQFCNPNADEDYWQVWHTFEVKYGNEDTYREMLRVKRSVLAKFTSQIDHLTQQLLESQKQQEEQQSGSKIEGFVKEDTMQVTEHVNPEEIEIDDEDSSEEEKDIEQVTKSQIPAAVFGSLVADEKIGAKDRFKRKRGE